MKLLMVVPRFAEGIVGGAENLIRALATHAVGPQDTVEIATTCALDHETWRNELTPGDAVVDGLHVRRFEVGQRDERGYAERHERLLDGRRLSYLDELEMMSASVWSPGLQRFLEDQGRDYDLLVFAPYLFGTTYWGSQIWPERTVIVPCLHDEPDAHMTCIGEMMESVRCCMFNTRAEERLARRLYRVRSGGVVGLGFEPPQAAPAVDFASRWRLGRYLVYVGRLEEGKRVDVAVEYAARFAASQVGDLRLVLVGTGSYTVPDRYRHFVVEAGFVDEETKRAAYAQALALVQPSELESLSMVMLEAWLEGTPALAAAGSEVMREHCELSGGGFTFSDYPSFARALSALLADPSLRGRMGAAGRDYVLSAHGWPAVRERFQTLARAAVGPTLEPVS